MKKRGILHPDLSRALATVGHYDIIVVADAGLALPNDSRRVDLAIVDGIPSVSQLLDILLNEVAVEQVSLASELREWDPQVLDEIEVRLGGRRPSFEAHDDLKGRWLREAKFFIRSGQCSAYASVGLTCDVSYRDRALRRRAAVEAG